MTRVFDISITPAKRIFSCLLVIAFISWIGMTFISDLDDVRFDAAAALSQQVRLSGRNVSGDADQAALPLDLVKQPSEGGRSSLDVTPPYPGDSAQHLHVFMQISDIHLSVFYDKKRAPDFEKFCVENIDVIKPEVVLVTGDLTDAKYPDRQGSVQYLDEWQEYDSVIKRTGVLKKTVWLDIRGNHDTFNVPSLQSEQNYYRLYSHQGQKSLRSYRYEHKTSDGSRYDFIAVDACPDPGPRRPFNFFGHLNPNDMEDLTAFSRASVNSNMTLYFGHYPTSTIGNHVDELRRLIGSTGFGYLSGHLHTFGGVVPHMYVRHKTGFLELEVGDWMDNRLYRVFAIDHDVFSFIDVPFGTWPVALVTNPKHGRFINPLHEASGRMLQSTHIRVLAFSPSAITKVRVRIDKEEWRDASLVQGSLYVLPWTPKQYLSGVHNMEVVVKDAAGRETRQDQPFTLDNSHIGTDFVRRFILMSHHVITVRFLFYAALTCTLLPLAAMKLCHINLAGSSVQNKDLIETFFEPANPSIWDCCLHLTQTWLRRYSLLCQTNVIYWPLVIYTLWIAAGPWFIAEIIDGHLGAMFVFGIYVNGSFIPGTLSYLYGFFQLLLFNFPLCLYLGRCLDQTWSEHKHPDTSRLPRPISWLFAHGPFVLMVAVEAWLAWGGFFKAYGSLALVLGPVRVWGVILAIYLRRISLRKLPVAPSDENLK